MNKKRIFALAFAVLMLLALAACGTKNFSLRPRSISAMRSTVSFALSLV